MLDLTLTDQQVRALDYLLTINARRDVEKEIKAWSELAMTGLSNLGDEENERFRATAASNHQFYVEKLGELHQLTEALTDAKLGRAYDRALAARRDKTEE